MHDTSVHEEVQVFSGATSPISAPRNKMHRRPWSPAGAAAELPQFYPRPSSPRRRAPSPPSLGGASGIGGTSWDTRKKHASWDSVGIAKRVEALGHAASPEFAADVAKLVLKARVKQAALEAARPQHLQHSQYSESSCQAQVEALQRELEEERASKVEQVAAASKIALQEHRQTIEHLQAELVVRERSIRRLAAAGPDTAEWHAARREAAALLDHRSASRSLAAQEARSCALRVNAFAPVRRGD